MSLFRTKEFWRTSCGIDEFFHKNSLLVTPLLGPDLKDLFIVGSTSGYLRIYCPSSRWSDESRSTSTFKSTDLIIEVKLSDCIVDIQTGKFVSGSSENHLAVLTTKKLAVYNISLTKGPTEYGDKCSLNGVYEHLLSCLPASLTIGSFGGVSGREFFCIQNFDGTLQFYEQEAYMFSRILNDSLLPNILLYNWKSDALITCNSNWHLDLYNYSNIAESGRKNDKNGKEIPKELKPDLSFNIGEPVIDMNIVAISSLELVLFVLGTRNMYYFNASNLTLTQMKKLDYSALCCCTYVTEPDGQLMVGVVVDTDTLLIYEGTTLRWSAQFSYTPVAIARAQTQYLEGVIVILSEDGRLEACYLGSEPSVFTGQRIFNRSIDAKRALSDVQDYEKLAKIKEKYDGTLSDVALKSELLIALTVSHGSESKQKIPTIIGKIVITLSSYVTLFNVQVFIEMPKPLSVSEPDYKIANLCQKHVMETNLHLDDNSISKSTEFFVTATYTDKDDNYRFVQKSSHVPISYLIRPSVPENVASLNVTIKSAGPALHINQLLPDLIAESSEKHITNSLGLQHAGDNQVVTVVMGLMSNRYRVQSNCGTAMSLIVQQIVNKLLEKATDKNVISANHTHIQLVLNQMEARFEIRMRIHNILTELDLVMTQMREIEKRMLRAMVERNVKSLSSSELTSLLESTNSTFLLLLDDLGKAQEDLNKVTENLHCLINLMLCLIGTSHNSKTFDLLKSVIKFEPVLVDEVDWEEITDLCLTKILHQNYKKMETQRKSTFTRFTNKEEFDRLKQRFIFAFEKFNKDKELSEVSENPTSDIPD